MADTLTDVVQLADPRIDHMYVPPRRTRKAECNLQTPTTFMSSLSRSASADFAVPPRSDSSTPSTSASASPSPSFCSLPRQRTPSPSPSASHLLCLARDKIVRMAQRIEARVLPPLPTPHTTPPTATRAVRNEGVGTPPPIAHGFNGQQQEDEARMDS